MFDVTDIYGWYSGAMTSSNMYIIAIIWFVTGYDIKVSMYVIGLCLI